MTEGLALAVCRDAAGLGWLELHVGRTGTPCVVASDDFRVRSAAQRLSVVKEVSYLEAVESYYAVAEEVIEILGRVNAWLGRAEHRAGISKGLLFWPQHCEGGDTTQRVQDGLLLIRSYQKLIARYHPTEILLIGRSDSAWEDDLLQGCAESEGIAFKRVGTMGLIGPMRRLWRRLRPFAKEIYRSAEVGAALLRNAAQDAPVPSPSGYVAIQLCDRAKKHLNHTVPLLRALDREGLQGVAICWGVGDAVQGLRRDGLQAVQLEAWVGWRTLIESWFAAWRLWRAARAAEADFLPPPQTPHSGLLRPALWAALRVFFLSDVANRYRLDRGLRKYWGAHPPTALRPWTRILPQGVIAYRALPEDCKPLVFWQPQWPYHIVSPYKRYDVPAGLAFSISEEHARALTQDGFTPAQVVFAGSHWLEIVRRFKQSFSREESRRMLGIPQDTVLCLLCDPGYFLRGYLAAAEQAVLLETLLDLARNRREIHLLIKPHSAHKKGLLDAILADYRLPNLTLIPPADLPYHALNAADVLVTKLSMLALEGMELGVPSVAALFDGERNFAFYEDAVENIWHPAELADLLRRLLDEPDFRRSWTDSLREKSARYLLRHSTDTGADPNRTIARHLREALERRHELQRKA